MRWSRTYFSRTSDASQYICWKLLVNFWLRGFLNRSVDGWRRKCWQNILFWRNEMRLGDACGGNRVILKYLIKKFEKHHSKNVSFWINFKMMHERHYCFLVHESFDVILKLCQANILCSGRILSICRCYPFRCGSELFNLLAALTLYVIMWKLIHLTFWSILMHVRYMTGWNGFNPFHCSIDTQIINFSRHPQILHWPKFRNSNQNLIHHHFSPEELKPTPIQKKSRKQLVRDEDKDDKYWDKVRPLWPFNFAHDRQLSFITVHFQFEPP